MATGMQRIEAPEVTEGRLLAQRHVLAALVAAVLDEGAGRERLRGMLSRDAVEPEHEEDPGAEPDAAFAIEAAIDEELRWIAREVAALRDGDGG